MSVRMNSGRRAVSRCCVLANCLLWAGVHLAPQALAAPGFDYTLVRDFDIINNATQEEVLCSFAFNDLGQVAYMGQLRDLGNPNYFTTSIYFWDEGTEHLVHREEYEFGVTQSFPTISWGCQSNSIGLNNNGLITFSFAPMDANNSQQAVLHFRAGAGLVGTGLMPIHASLWSRGNLNDAGQVPYMNFGVEGSIQMGAAGVSGLSGHAATLPSGGSAYYTNPPVVSANRACSDHRRDAG
jgi:hypothetical protein